jgi:aspartyl-tRNA(Asn)/glutamyl-tRNA(Gln) amidotransferase subunit B
MIILMSKYIPTIGLEIHAELKTKTKMFCNSINDPDETEPNVNVCPICLGHPGTLPVLNKEAIKLVLKIGQSINAEIADYTEWDRKNYFYPDIPKGYQISQYKYPLVRGGNIHGVDLTRIHLEEDTGTSIHDRGDYSLINFNRAGVPLMELVTEPVIHSSKQAVEFAKELQLLLRYLGASEANMEKGEMRVEANISIAPEGADKLGTKVEVKNLNSFKTVERAIEYEIKRMTELLDQGKGSEIVQETRGWDEAKQKTFRQRIKESSDDYRYFPEPDLPKLKISEIPEFSREKLIAELPELPWEKRSRYKSDYNMKEGDIENIVGSPNWYLHFEEIINLFDKLKEKKEILLAVNYFVNDYMSLYNESMEKKGFAVEATINPIGFSNLIRMISVGEISSRGAKETLRIMYFESPHEENPKKIAEKNNLLQQSDIGALEDIVKKIITDNKKVVDEYKSGKEASLQFLIGQGMKETKGSANPKLLSDLFKKLI